MVYERDRGLYKLFGKLFLQVISQTVQKYYLSHRATDDSAPLYKFKKNYTLVEVKKFLSKMSFVSR